MASTNRKQERVNECIALAGPVVPTDCVPVNVMGTMRLAAARGKVIEAG